MVVFKSIVILDLESSGLPSSGGKTKITELSFLGVLRDHLLESHRKCEAAPRVLQKLSLCFYPQKRIDFEASEITGLDNFLLEEIPAFNPEACEMVLSFLHRMPPPLCIVAHNGMKFDFQLLKSELAAKDKVLPDEIFCADSILAFRTLFPVRPMWSLTPALTSPTRTTLSNDPVTPEKHTQVVSHGPVLDCAEVNLPPILESKRLNETTPKNSSLKRDCPLLLKRRSSNNDENRIVRKKLFKGEGPPKSYKLGDLYSHLHGREPEHGHRAESDCLSLLECIVSTAPEFLSWVENNNIAFKNIPCMW